MMSFKVCLLLVSCAALACADDVEPTPAAGPLNLGVGVGVGVGLNLGGLFGAPGAPERSDEEIAEDLAALEQAEQVLAADPDIQYGVMDWLGCGYKCGKECLKKCREDSNKKVCTAVCTAKCTYKCKKEKKSK